MLKEALQLIIGLGNQKQFEINGQQFSNQSLHLIKQATPDALTVRSVTGFVDYLKSHYDTDSKLMVHVESPTKVVAFSSFNLDMERDYLIKAEALLPAMQFGQWHDPEDFIIKLQSVFVNEGDRADLLRLVGNITDDNVTTFGDDGISQKVTAKIGIAVVGDVPVPNPVKLFPFRTFVELDQPESLFVFRLRKGPECALFDADGGAWKVEAMDTVREYLEKELADEVKDGKIVIIA